jgi:hypothetical protein
MPDANLETLQRFARLHYNTDLNGALKIATGIDKDANGVSQQLYGVDLGANSFNQLLDTLGGYLTALRMTGAAGQGCTTPNHASLQITSDVAIKAWIRPKDWTRSVGFNSIWSKFLSTGNQRAYRLRMQSNGALEFAWSVDGIATLTITTDAAGTAVLAALLDNTDHCVGVSFDANNGAAGRTAKFYHAAKWSGPWTQLGADVVQATATSILATTALGEVGAVNSGAADNFDGDIYQIEVRSGLWEAGTVVVNPNFRNLTPGVTSIVDTAAVPKTFSIVGTAQIAKAA